MSAKQLLLPANRTFNSNGVAVSGAVVKLYTSGTLTPANFYSDDALTTILGPTLTCNAAGRLSQTAYQDALTPFRLRIEDANGDELEDIDPYYFGTITGTVLGSEGSVASSRTVMAAMLGTSGATVTLTESGREGLFVWSGSNLSARVTADPGQGVYVPPTTDTTGASGAWVRKFSGPHNVMWFGAVADDATDTSTAFTRAISFLNAAALSFVAYSGSGAGEATGELFIPKGEYYLGTTTLDLTYTTIITGESVGEAGGHGTKLRWAAGCDGIRVQRFNTTGATGNLGAGPYTYPGGDASIIRGLYLKGAFSTTEGDYHGIRLRARASVRDCTIDSFQGDGVHIHATGATDGNANCSELYRVYATANRRGFYCTSNDTNACSFINCSAIGNRQSGVHDNAFITNTYLNCHVASNGYGGTGTAGLPAIGCSSGGNLYAVVLGQESGAASNAPSGTTADNTWWLYWKAGGATTGFPAFSAGTQTFRAGGGFVTEGSATTALFGCYSEGDQPPTQLGQNTLVSSGGYGTRVVGGGHAFASGNEVRLSSLFVGDGTTVYFHANSSHTRVRTGVFYIDAVGSAWSIHGRQSDGATEDWQVYGVGSYANYYTTNNASNGHRFQTQTGGDIAVINDSGVAIQGTKTLTTGGLISSSSATAGIGYATGAGGTVTQATSRTTGVTLNKVCGTITLVSAAGSATYQSFTVTNSTVAANDTIRVNQQSGTDLYEIHVTAVAAGSFRVTYRTTGGTTTEQPVFNFAVTKGVAA